MTKIQGNLLRKLDPTPTLTLSLVCILDRERKWIDIERGTFCQGCFDVSKIMIRLLRHDKSIHREEDGAVRFDDLAALFKSRFEATSHWPIHVWISFSAKGEGQKQKFQHCLNPILPNISCISEQSKEILEVLLLILHCKTMCCYRMTSPSTSTTSGTLTTCTPSFSVD